jgi:hypothetical protein
MVQKGNNFWLSPKKVIAKPIGNSHNDAGTNGGYVADSANCGLQNQHGQLKSIEECIMLKKIMATVIAFGGICVAPTAFAQSAEIISQLSAQLRAARNSYVPNSYSLVTGPDNDILSQGESDNYNVTLQGGRSYKLVGVCDNDCSDLDITLYDSDGDVVDRDLLDDDKPVVSVSGKSSGRYRMNVSMAACSTGVCYYSVAVYGN